MTLSDFIFAHLGTYLCISLTSIWFYSAHKAGIYRHHALKVLSSLSLIFSVTYAYHEHQNLLLFSGCYLILSPLIWPFDFYSTLFRIKSFLTRSNVFLLSTSVFIIVLISYLIGQDSWVVNYAFCAIPIHLAFLAIIFFKSKNFLSSDEQGKVFMTISLVYEFLFFSLLFWMAVTGIFLEYLYLISILSGVHLIFLRLALSPRFLEYLALQKQARIQANSLRKKNLEDIKNNIELEKNLSMVSSQNNLSSLPSDFINVCILKVKELLQTNTDKSSLILTHLAKYLRYQLISNQNSLGSVRNEETYLTHYLQLNELVFEEQNIRLNKQNLSSAYEKDTKTQVILPLIQTISSYLNTVEEQPELILDLKSSPGQITLDLIVSETESKADKVNFKDVNLSNLYIKLLSDQDQMGELSVKNKHHITLTLKVS